MRKIVHVIDNLSKGGAEVLLYNTIKKLPEIEHHIIILEHKIAFHDINSIASIHVINHIGWSSLIRSCNRIQKIIKELSPDIVHAHLFLSSFLTRLALKKNTNIVYTLHTVYRADLYKKMHLRLLEKYIYNREHKLIAVSHYVLDDYKKLVTECVNGYVLYNFIDDSFLKSKQIQEGKDLSLNKWVAVGSLKVVKNYMGMISLFESFYHCSHEKEKISLDIYGEGALMMELQQRIEQSALPIRLMGKVDNNIHEILDQYDAYISTSLYEGYGIAPMEALSRGLPVFLSDIPVFKEIYKSFAFYFQNNNPASFIDACNRYMILDETRKSTLKAQGQEFAWQVANSENYIKELVKIYTS